MLDLLQTAFNLNNHGSISSYWMLMVWIFLGGLILSYLPKHTLVVNGRPKECWYWISAILLTLPLVLWATFRSGFGDSLSYALIFRRSPATFEELWLYLSSNDVDKGFYTLITLLKVMGVESYLMFFFVVAAVQMWCMIYTFRKYGHNFWLCIFLFLASTDYMSWMFNGIRQFIAVCIIFAGFGLLVRRRYIAHIALVLLASTFHGSALLMIPLGYIMLGPAFNRKTMLAIIATIAVVPFIDDFLPFLEAALMDTQYNDILGNSVWANDDGTNIIRVLVYSVPALLALFGRRYIQRANNPAMNLCINASVLTMVIYLVSSVTSGIYIGRIPIYTTLHGYMVLPWIIDQIFEQQTARVIKFAMVVCYVGFFVFQMNQWGLL